MLICCLGDALMKFTDFFDAMRACSRLGIIRVSIAVSICSGFTGTSSRESCFDIRCLENLFYGLPESLSALDLILRLVPRWPEYRRAAIAVCRWDDIARHISRKGLHERAVFSLALTHGELPVPWSTDLETPVVAALGRAHIQTHCRCLAC